MRLDLADLAAEVHRSRSAQPELNPPADKTQLAMIADEALAAKKTSRCRSRVARSRRHQSEIVGTT
jgi:hypothetical protein